MSMTVPADDATQDHQLTLPTTIRRVVLTGFMGAGKTTVGRKLSRQLGWKFVDIDLMLEEKHACTVADIFTQHGEAGFRRFESHAIAQALGQSQIIIALGGGAPETLTNRLLLEQTPGARVVFLDAPFTELYDRCVLQNGAPVRPVLADPTVAETRFVKRQPFYRRLASVTVKTSGQNAEQTARAVYDALLKKQ